ncbi:hypothetical protein [Paenibacillus illinoisensis]|uniref:hypothetical protein n=1 Tax=Paenibacillus illinoisensis TaxID=59845 RepID=UPI00301826A1
MILKKQLLSANNLNNAFLSKLDTAEQSIAGDLRLNGGRLTLSNSVFTDDANTAYLRIDPQGNRVIVYDGVNNQQLDVYSSSGSESLYLTTINQANNQSYSLIDTSGVDHLEIATNSQKNTKFPVQGISIGASATVSENFHFTSDTSGGFRGFRLYNGNYGQGTHLLTVLSSGNVGIKTSTPAWPLHVVGDAYITGWVRSDTGYYISGYDGGWYMTDNTYLRNYANKQTLLSNSLILDTAGGVAGIGIQVGASASGRQVKNGGSWITGGTDAATANDANLKLHSWYGIGFAPSISGQAIPQGENAIYMNVRNGNLTARGTITAGAFVLPVGTNKYATQVG